jgi:hypothetical protein
LPWRTEQVPIKRITSRSVFHLPGTTNSWDLVKMKTATIGVPALPRNSVNPYRTLGTGQVIFYDVSYGTNGTVKLPAVVPGVGGLVRVSTLAFLKNPSSVLIEHPWQDSHYFGPRGQGGPGLAGEPPQEDVEKEPLPDQESWEEPEPSQPQREPRPQPHKTPPHKAPPPKAPPAKPKHKAQARKKYELTYPTKTW